MLYVLIVNEELEVWQDSAQGQCTEQHLFSMAFITA